MTSTLSAVGLDIGNYASCIALARKGGIDVIMNKESKRETPSVVSFSEKMRVFGSEAQAKKTMNFKNTISELRSLIGRNYYDARVQHEMKDYPYNISEGAGGKILVHIQYKGQPKKVSPAQVLAMLLVDLKALALTETPFSTCAIGVPCYYTEQERFAVLDAARIAEVNCVRLLNETTAIALSYGIFKTDIDDNNPINVAFVDVGHHALQVCIAQVKRSGVKILAHAWDDQLGGKGLDKVIFNYFADDFQQRYKLDVRSNKKASIKLMDTSERVKKVLSANAVAPVNLECFMDDVDVKGSMNREEFEKLAEPLLAKVHIPIERAIGISGVNLKQISSVELIGSSSRVPSIQNIVQHIFQKVPQKTLNAKECVSKGLAIQCAMLSPQFKVRDYQVIDCFPYSIDLEYEKQGSLTVQNLFPINSPVPNFKKLTLKRNKPFTLTFKYSKSIFEELPKGTNEVLAQYEVSGFSVPKGEENASISLHFKLNEHGLVLLENAYYLQTEDYEEKVPVTKDEADKSVKQFKKESSQEEIKDNKEAEEAAQQAHADGMDIDEAKKHNKQENSASQHNTQNATPEQGSDAKANKADDTVTYRVEKKQRQIKKILQIKQNISGGLSNSEIDKLHADECEMQASDRYEIETADKKNTLEAYIYSLRDNLYGKYEAYVKQDDRDKLASELDKLTDWLYDEGEDQGKSVYMEKLDYLKKKGDPIQSRYYEADNRQPAINSLQAYLQQCKEALTHKNFEHISGEDKSKIQHECESTATWLKEKIHLQQNSAKTDEPILVVNDIKKKHDTLNRFVQPLLSKPVPKAEKPKEQAKPQQAKKEDNHQGQKQQSNEQASGQPKEVDMEDTSEKQKDDAEMQT